MQLGRGGLDLNEPAGPDLMEPAYLDPKAWMLCNSPSSPATFIVTPPPSIAENPNSMLQCTYAPAVGELEVEAAMAYQRVDPRPFVPRTMVWQEVLN